MSSPLLITGATGSIGGHLVDRLVRDGHQVRVTSRRCADGQREVGLPGAGPRGTVEVVVGDFATGDLPRDTFDGVERVFVFPAEGGIDPFLARCVDAGVRHLVLLSSLAAAGEHERDRTSVSAVHHRAVERSVAATGIPTTVLRPGDFANNLRFWAWAIRTTGRVRAPYPTSAQAPIHEADIADVAAIALTTDGHEGATYALSGPESLTRAEQLATIGRAIGRELHFDEITPEEFAAELGAHVPPAVVSMLLDHWADTVEHPDPVRPTVAEITGCPGRPLAAWAADHAADFR